MLINKILPLCVKQMDLIYQLIFITIVLCRFTERVAELYFVCFSVFIAATFSFVDTRLSVEEEASVTFTAFCAASGALNNFREARTGSRAALSTHFIVTVGKAFHG